MQMGLSDNSRYVADNYRAVADAFGLGEPDLRSLAAASMAACFPRP